MRLKKKFIFLLLLVLLTNCGFTPIYKNGGNIDLKIIVNSVSGDRSTYNLISSNLKRYSYDDAINSAQIDINTKYEKNILAKDSTGKTTDYQIKIKAFFNIEIKELKKEITFVETFDYKSLAKSFEEIQYEETVKQNISNIITRKLIDQLSRF
jgi:hypothetical protein